MGESEVFSKITVLVNLVMKKTEFSNFKSNRRREIDCESFCCCVNMGNHSQDRKNMRGKKINRVRFQKS